MQKELDEVNDEIEDRDDQIGYLKGDLDTAKTEIKNLKAAVQDNNKMNDIIIKLTKELKQSQVEKKNAESISQNANFEKRQLISQIDKLEEEIETL